MGIPVWLIELKDWVQVLTPFGGLMVVIFWKPLRQWCDKFFQEKFIQPEVKQNEEINNINSKLDNILEQLDGMKKVHKSLLHHEVFVTAKKAIDNQCISSMELQNLDELYKEYKNLDGNGTAERLYEEAKKLELRD